MRYAIINKDFWHTLCIILSFVAGCYVASNVMKQ